MIDIKDCSMLERNTFGIDVKANRFIEYSSVEELQRLIHSQEIPSPTSENDARLLHIGGGSNLLFTQDFNGTILHSGVKSIEPLSSSECDVTVRVGAGVVWDEFVEHAVSNSWYGVENLSLIPGEVGASAVQNIGAYGVEAKDVILTVETVNLTDGSIRTFTNQECEYGYRTSIFKTAHKGKYAVTHVTFKLSRTFIPQLEYGNISSCIPADQTLTAELLRRTIIRIRESKLPDPKVLGNAGSFFMNPIVCIEKFNELKTDYPDMPHYSTDNGVKIPAGWLIEQCGWKGRALGPAGVHSHQALVLVNLGGATGQDILNLCESVRNCVSDKFGIEIQPEVNVI